MFLRDLEEDPEFRANVNIYKQEDQIESGEQEPLEEKKEEEQKGGED